MSARRTRVIATIGPATAGERALRRIRDKGVDFVRGNMSHSTLEEFDALQRLAREVGLPYILDTEGSQLRMGPVRDGSISFRGDERVRIHAAPRLGDPENLALRPPGMVAQLAVGDLVLVDFDTLILRVSDVSTAEAGFVTAHTISGGRVGSNKAVVIEPAIARRLHVPPLSDKDLRAIEIGLRAGVRHIAASFVRSGASVDEVRRVTENRMRVISKIECRDALENLDEILARTDAILIDRGDLSKEIPMERIPYAQKIILDKARRAGREAFVATNLLETMVRERKPTRAEVQDVVNTILDGASGLTLAAETAVGRHPMECINVLNTLICHAESIQAAVPSDAARPGHALIRELEASGYLIDQHLSSALPEPHGGRLVDRAALDPPDPRELDRMPQIRLDPERQIEVEQIATGVYSPLRGFLGQKDLRSVLDQGRLADGTPWPLPILLDVALADADRLSPGEPVALADHRGDRVAILHLREIYPLDRDDLEEKLRWERPAQRAGTGRTPDRNPALLAGEVELLKRGDSGYREYELSPRQLRRLFEDRGWCDVLALQVADALDAGRGLAGLPEVEEGPWDGRLAQILLGVGGEPDPAPDVEGYRRRIERHYPPGGVVFSTLPVPRPHAGPRATALAALRAKNFGCSHFAVLRADASGDGSDDPDARAWLSDRLPDLGISFVELRRETPGVPPR